MNLINFYKEKVKFHCEKAEKFDLKIGNIDNKDDEYTQKTDYHYKRANYYQKLINKELKMLFKIEDLETSLENIFNLSDISEKLNIPVKILINMEPKDIILKFKEIYDNPITFLKHS